MDSDSAQPESISATEATQDEIGGRSPRSLPEDVTLNDFDEGSYGSLSEDVTQNETQNEISSKLSEISSESLPEKVIQDEFDEESFRYVPEEVIPNEFNKGSYGSLPEDVTQNEISSELSESVPEKVTQDEFDKESTETLPEEVTQDEFDKESAESLPVKNESDYESSSPEEVTQDDIGEQSSGSLSERNLSNVPDQTLRHRQDDFNDRSVPSVPKNPGISESFHEVDDSDHANPSLIQLIQSSPNEKIFTTSHGIRIRVYVGDISKASADAVVTSEDPYSSDMSMVSRALCEIPGGNEFKEKRVVRQTAHGPLNIGGVYTLSVKNTEFPFKYVLQAIIIGFDPEMKLRSWRKLLKMLYTNIYRKADEKDLRSVAVPLLGTGRGQGGTDVSVDAAVRTLCTHRPLSLEEVQFVSLDRDVNNYISVIFESCCSLSDFSSESEGEDEENGDVVDDNDDDDNDDDDGGEEDDFTEEKQFMEGNYPIQRVPYQEYAATGRRRGLVTQQKQRGILVSRAVGYRASNELQASDDTGGNETFHRGLEASGRWMGINRKRNKQQPTAIDNDRSYLDEGDDLQAGFTIFRNRNMYPDTEGMPDELVFDTVIDEDLVQTGNQPPGTMSLATLDDTHLPGYENTGTIVIDYQIPSGYQTNDHPHPGRMYFGVSRRAFLPDNESGRMVMRMLKTAFERRLVFTVGRSQTTGQDDTVIWGPISHKTRPTGGPARYGYPDNYYLDRVTNELLNLGVIDPASATTNDMNSLCVENE